MVRLKRFALTIFVLLAIASVHPATADDSLPSP